MGSTEAIRLQKALAKARRTHLKQVGPGRYVTERTGNAGSKTPRALVIRQKARYKPRHSRGPKLKRSTIQAIKRAILQLSK